MLKMNCKHLFRCRFIHWARRELSESCLLYFYSQTEKEIEKKCYCFIQRERNRKNRVGLLFFIIYEPNRKLK